MKVAVDSGRCMGHGQCYSYGPEVYESDDEGFCVVLKHDVKGDEIEQAIKGAAACPESAIAVSEECDV